MIGGRSQGFIKVVKSKLDQSRMRALFPGVRSGPVSAFSAACIPTYDSFLGVDVSGLLKRKLPLFFRDLVRAFRECERAFDFCLYPLLIFSIFLAPLSISHGFFAATPSCLVFKTIFEIKREYCSCLIVCRVLLFSQILISKESCMSSRSV